MMKRAIIAYLSTYPPRECGIATFAEDLVQAVDDFFAPSVKSVIIAINPSEVADYVYPKKVIFEITKSKENEYFQVTEKINKILT